MIEKGGGVRSKPFLSILFLMVFSAAVAAPGYPALFTNGGFEGTWSGPHLTLNAPSTDIPGWAVTFGSIDWINTTWPAAEGSFSIDLSGDGLGQISQTFDAVIGQQYRVSFQLAGNPASGDTIKDLQATVLGSTSSQIFSFDTTGKSLTNMGWEERFFLFTALVDSVTLQFTSFEGNPYGPALDGVSVEAVPIPTAAWLLGTGLIGLVALRRKLGS
jgi:choice-of-anchor C domain-containing protein